MIMYPFRFFDAVLRLGFVIALLPFFIVAWVFKVTRGYVQAAWMMFLNAVISLGFLIIMMKWILELLSCGLGGKEAQQELITQYLLKGEVEKGILFLLQNPTHFLVTFAVMYIASQLLNLNETLVGYLTETKAIPAIGYRQGDQMMGIGEQIVQRVAKIKGIFSR